MHKMVTLRSILSQNFPTVFNVTGNNFNFKKAYFFILRKSQKAFSFHFKSILEF